jgi:hypothetical protein
MKKRQMWHVMLEGAPLADDPNDKGRRVLYRRRGGGPLPVARVELELDVEAADLADACTRALDVASHFEQEGTARTEAWRVVMAEMGREVWTAD